MENSKGNAEEQRVHSSDIANMRSNISLLRSQLEAGRIDREFFNKQFDKLDAMLQQMDASQERIDQTERFEALYTVSRALGSSLDLQVVLDQVMDSIISLTEAERGFLMMHDDDGGLNVRAARNFDQQTIPDDEFRFSRTVVNEVLDTNAPILTTNATEDPRFAGRSSIVSQALRSIMASPLLARGNTVGVVYVDSRANTGLFQQDDLEALEAFSTQAAITLDNARLFGATDEALQRRLEDLRQLRRIDMQLNETLDVDRAMQFALEWAVKLSQADVGLLGLVGGNPGSPQVANVTNHGYPEGEAPTQPIEELYPDVVRAVQDGQTLHLTETEAGTACVIVPIKRDRDVVGVIVLERHLPHPFSEEQADLVERVATRASIAIENAQLYAAVQAADRAKSEFVGVVAHDLKSPMTGIKGYADLLLMQEDLTQTQTSYLKKIRDTVERMEILVSDLADISRIESGHFYMEEMLFAVEDVVQAVKDATLPQIEEREHTLVEDVEPDMPPVKTDYYRLLQVLTNLVSNAYKYTPNRGTITLTAHLQDERVYFSVADTGIGMSKEQLAVLGTKFWRADDDFTRAQPGTGLGFAITKSLVEQMGSAIKVESEVGKGSRFSFSVPIERLR